MARTSHHTTIEIEAAKQIAMESKSLERLRQAQAVLIPALTGASMETTADILGVGRNKVCTLRREFRNCNGQPSEPVEKRGGRRNQLMTLEEERAFLKPWIKDAEKGGVLSVSPIHVAYEQAVGRKVSKSTVYRLLARHG